MHDKLPAFSISASKKPIRGDFFYDLMPRVTTTIWEETDWHDYIPLKRIQEIKPNDLFGKNRRYRIIGRVGAYTKCDIYEAIHKTARMRFCQGKPPR